MTIIRRSRADASTQIFPLAYECDKKARYKCGKKQEKTSTDSESLEETISTFIISFVIVINDDR
jgi:hypothetical protein